ncbi:MAG TPA: isoprenylcysteine carboxylmethyltransferase family protein [Polyangiaceae bacterium]|nr:isoprenylcysteine carboxylmethyltransferase family protein [Polyangiaceae bacterium]
MSDSAQVPVIPPAVPLAFLAVGALVQMAIPLSIGPLAVVRPLGLVALATSTLLVAFAVHELRRAKTAFDVRRPTTRLVTTGVYRLSRNPVYLSIILLCWAVGFLTNALFVLVAAIPAASTLCIVVIRREERYLRKKFDAEFVEYCRRVRRWI